MASKSASTPAPLTFDLPASLIDKIQATVRSDGTGPKSVSEVVRQAVTHFDFDAFSPAREPHRQISVRLSGDLRTQLNRTARRKQASLGELVRAALEALPAAKVQKPAVKKSR